MQNTTHELSQHFINRRTLSLFALSSFVSACGGGGGSQPIAAPEITGQPQDASVQEGQQASFTVTIKDEAQASYQWARNGTAIAGATQKSLSVSRAELSDNGAQFSVAISNPAGSAQSRQARLTVQTVARVPGEVILSGWSNNLPTPRVTDIFTNVGTSGLIYTYRYEDSATVLQRYRSDGAAVPLGGSLARHTTGSGWARFSVLEEPGSGDVLIAEGRFGGGINQVLGLGGRLLRINASSGAVTILYESQSITPLRLARDGAGNLYTLDMATWAIFRLSPQGQMSRLTSVLKPGAAGGEAWRRTYWLAVAADGTVYAAVDGPDSRNAVVRWRNGVEDYFDTSINPTYNSVMGLGTYGNDAYVLHSSDIAGRVLRKLSASGTISTVAGTPGATNPSSQLGSPGVIVDAEWLDISATGRIFLVNPAVTDMRFLSVVLP